MRRMVNKFCFSVLALLLTITIVNAQEVKVREGFLSDSIRIGESVPFSVSVQYPQQINVLFPDSTYSFAPFEYASKKFFPTQTINGISYDSVVYYLTTFEIDKVQKLTLPIFITTARDCTQYNSSTDSVYLFELVKNPPDSVAANDLPLKANTLYEKVFSEINYVIALLLLTALVFISLIIWLFFGKRIIRYFKSKKLLKKHNEFVERFTSNLNQLSSAFSREQAEFTLSLWKKYMEQIEQKPYTKLTTRETARILPDGNIKNNLQLLDRAIYGHQTSVIEPLKALQRVAEEHFHKILENVKNG